MKLLRRPYWFPLLSLMAGGVGFALQLWLFSSGTDYKGLIVETHPTVLPLAILSLSFPLLLGLLIWRIPFKTVPSQATFVGQPVAAAGIAISLFLKLLPGGFLIQALGWAAAVALLLLVSYQSKLSFWLCSIVSAFFVALPISQYRQWSIETQLVSFFAPLLASLSLQLTCYYRTAGTVGLFYNKRFLFFGCCAVLFCAMSAAGDLWAFYFAMLVWTAAELFTVFPKKLSLKNMPLPQPVAYCLYQLQSKGYDAYVVGGCIRDALLGKQPLDYDLCTSATPEEIAAVFEGHQLIRSGEKHGTIGVVLEEQVCEITTFRTEGVYSDCRHPDNVAWCKNIKDDLARRDFTANAMAYAPKSGLIDPWNGRLDLEDRLLRAVGDPETRFGEDALRILRGVRFAVHYNLTVEPKTKNAMLSQAPLLDAIAKERIFEELSKILPFATAQALTDFAPIFTQVIPELAASVGFDQQTRHHAYDVYSHTARVVEATPNDPALRWAALLHDVGKPAAFAPDEQGQGHFPGHAQLSADAAEEILRRLKAPNALREQVVFLIENHMLSLPPDRKVLRRRIGKYGPEQVASLLALQKADFVGKGVFDPDRMQSLGETEALLAELLAEADCLTLKDLTINGDALIALGYAPGKKLGECLQQLFEAVLEERLPNEPEALMEEARKILENRSSL